MPEVTPFVAPPSVPADKVQFASVLVSAITPFAPVPRAVESIVTTPLDPVLVAVTPIPAGQAAIASARFVAWVETVEFRVKVPV